MTYLNETTSLCRVVVEHANIREETPSTASRYLPPGGEKTMLFA
jgi:hypothetical protein